MSLLNLWKTSELLLKDKSVKQIIAIAGNGKLSDGNPTSVEFRNLLSLVSSDLLARYADECLAESFPESGLVLQDTINEIGRRLGFNVKDGRYRGKIGDIGNDGLWVLKDGSSIVVEVKTTDAYRIDLNVIAGYRNALFSNGTISEKNSSILIIVGRADTDDLEAQIRGSRHAWDIRLISILSLVQLMRLKESVEDPNTLHRIHQLLMPKEFTKLDAIVELLFATREDVKEANEIGIVENDVKLESKTAPKFKPVAFNDLCAELVAKHLGKTLIKRTRALFSTPNENLQVVCAVSRKYEDSKQGNYWFAFHTHQRQALESNENTYVAFGCGTPEFTILIPGAKFISWLDGMGITENEQRLYWHVQIFVQDDGPILIRRKGEPKINLSEYRIPEQS
jgi:hypothetical protein